MNLFAPFICSLTLGLVFSACQSTPPVGESTPFFSGDVLTWHGRYSLNDSATEARFAWTGAGFSVRFKGTRCEAALHTLPFDGEEFLPEAYYELIVDGQPAQKIAVGATPGWVSLSTGLKDTIHTLSLRRRTETLAGISLLKGLRLNTGGTWLTPPKPEPYALFIGNSITCGYGNEGDSATCHFQPAGENGRFTYATVAAASTGLDVDIVAYSGRGMIRNYDRTQYGLVPVLWPKTWGDPDAPVWDMNAHPAPKVVCINVGTNDFAHSIPPRNDFVGAYLKFVQTIRAQYPGVPVVLLTGSMMSGQPLQTIKSYLDEVKSQAGDEGIYRFDLTTQGPLGIGCDYHPNLAQHALNGKELGTFLQTILK